MSETIDETKAIKLPSECGNTAVMVESGERTYSSDSNTLDEETVEQLVEDRFVSGIVAPHARKKPQTRTTRTSDRKRKKKRSFAMNALIVLLISVLICIVCFVTSYLMFSQPDDSSENSNPYDYSVGGKPPVKSEEPAIENEPEADEEENTNAEASDEKADDKQEKKEETKPAQKEPSTVKPQKNNSATSSEKEPVSEVIKPSKPEKEKPSTVKPDIENSTSTTKPSEQAPSKPSNDNSNEGIVFE